MSISPAQARAALGLLGLKQTQLYEAVGITRQGYHSFLTTGRSHRKDAIRTFFEERGVEFTDHDGVRRKPVGTRTLEGYEGFKEFVYDVYETVRDVGGHICVTNVDESEWLKWSQSYIDDYIAKMKTVENLDFFILVQEGDDYHVGSSYAEYRKVPSQYFNSAAPVYVYGNKKAQILFSENNVTVSIFENAQLAEAERKQFALLWESAIA